MQNKFITSFLTTFFMANNCTIQQNEDGILRVQLTKELDKALMNRPFYWQYMTSTGQIGEPMEMTLITNPDKQQEKGEWVHFGTRRLEQISHYLEKQAKYTLLFQTLKTNERTMLQPWLLINYCIMYEGKQKKEELKSIGLNLINGMMIGNMMELLAEVPLDQTISDQCYTISPLITMQSGYLRIEKHIDHYIEEQNHSWAVESLELLQEELQMLEHFYRSNHAEDEKNQEIESITGRLGPKIHHQVVNGGLLYLEKGIFD